MTYPARHKLRGEQLRRNYKYGRMCCPGGAVR